MKKILMILATVGLLYSCSNDNSDENLSTGTDFINLSEDTLSVGPDGGNLDVLVESSGDWALVGPKVDWTSPSMTKGQNGQTLTFNVKPNEVNKVLSNTYKIFTGSAVQKLTVISNPSMMLELVSESEVAVTSEKTVVNISLSTNETNLSYEFSNEGAQWIKVLSFESAFGKETLLLEVSANDKYVSRNSVLTIKGSEKSVTVDITQAQQDALLEDGEVYKETGLSEGDLQFDIKTNIDYELSELPEWIELKETIKGETVDGLQKQTLVFHVLEAIASRRTDISLMKDSKVYLTLTAKQQNPNPVMVTIPDLNFRQALAEKEWVILGETDEDAECELLEKGITETTLDLSGTLWNNYGITSLEGIEQFPQIKVLKLAYNEMEVIDISKLKNVEELNFQSVYPLHTVIIGDNPVTSVVFNDYVESSSLSISGTNITNINAYLSSWSSYYDILTTLDVTGCPKLKTCNVDRQKLQTLYVTQEQKDNVEFTIRETCQIVVK